MDVTEPAPASAVFDADSYLEALAPPRLKLGGREYVGRLLSFEEWLGLAERTGAAVASLSRGGTPAPGEYLRFRATIRELFDAIFPRPWWALWRPRVSALLMRQPLHVQIDAVRSFCQSQARAFAADEAAATAGPQATPTP